MAVARARRRSAQQVEMSRAPFVIRASKRAWLAPPFAFAERIAASALAIRLDFGPFAG